MTANVPTMATGTATSGISAARQFCRNTSTTSGHQHHRLEQRPHDVVDRFADERRRVVGDVVVDAVGEAAVSSSILARTRSATSRALVPGS